MSKLTECLIEKKTDYIPIWFMRQAGRHLSEFRLIRKKNPDFIRLCLNSSLSSEISLQPLERYDLDAAIIFSDILMIPYAIGQTIEFVDGQGPILSEFKESVFFKRKINCISDKLNPVYDAISKTKNKLPKNKTLICFVGAPWTLVYYMKNFKKNPSNFNNVEMIKKIIDKLVIFICEHINNQKKAGAEVVQIFDSWAGIIDDNRMEDFCYKPNKIIIDYCKKIKIPCICFPKGIGEKYKDFNNYVKPDGLSIDYEINVDWALKNLSKVCLQGGLDPKLLIKGDKKRIHYEIDKYLKTFKNTPYIFNLGHGILPNTKPEVLEDVIRYVRNYE